MTPLRETFWNIPKWAELSQYVLGVVAMLVFVYGVYRRVRRWRLGRPEVLTGTLKGRVWAFILYALAQVRVATDRFSGVMHLSVFWGMVVLFFGTILATVDWDVTRPLLGFRFLQGNFYLGYELLLDIFGIFALVGLALALYRRYILRAPRLKSETLPTFVWDDAYLLGMLLVIVISGFLIEGVRIAALDPPWSGWSPVGAWLASFYQPLSPAALSAVHFGLWSAHGLLAFLFIASIPFTKAFHFVTAPLNIFLRDFSSPGALKKGVESGAEKITDFSWKQLLELEACTWCGRCQEACPAYASGLPLNPKALIMKLDAQLLRLPAAQRLNPGVPQDVALHLHGVLVTAPELWSCTACAACAEVCPVFVRHPGIIVEMRRYLVNQGAMDGRLQDALMNLTRYGNSFGQSERARGRWTQGLGFEIPDARRQPVEFLWFAGDYAAFDPRVQAITRATARVFRAAGLDVGILYEAERNAGNDVRRVGEEGLFEALMEKNVQALGKAQFRQVVTTDPHTYHVLKNEYGVWGDGAPDGSARVLHCTELLDTLLQTGRLPIRKRLSVRATYHDPCFLGRYNGVYDSPRRVLEALGITLREMPRSRRHSYCCGAGGGRIWMEETPGIKERPAESRVREAAALGVDTLVVACPKDYVMFQDALKTTGLEGKLFIRDVMELVDEATAPAEG